MNPKDNLAKISPNSFFYMQQLMLDKRDREKIENAVVAVAGIGGVSSYALELLVRNGFKNFKIADFDGYEERNVYQLFITRKDIGRPKLDTAIERLRAINPEVKISSYSEGVHSKNIDAFLSGVDVVCAQTDSLASQIILYYGANKNKVPLIHAGRAEWPKNKNLVTAFVYDFRESKEEFDLKLLGLATNVWGANNIELLEEMVVRLKRQEDCSDLVKKINKSNEEYRKEVFFDTIKTSDVPRISDKPREYLLRVAELYPESFHKMAVTPELGAIAGSLVVATLKDIILNRPIKRLAINLYNGELFENYGTQNNR